MPDVHSAKCCMKGTKMPMTNKQAKALRNSFKEILDIELETEDIISICDNHYTEYPEIINDINEHRNFVDMIVKYKMNAEEMGVSAEQWLNMVNESFKEDHGVDSKYFTNALEFYKEYQEYFDNNRIDKIYHSIEEDLWKSI